MIAETRSYIFRWHSRCRPRRFCLRSLIDHRGRQNVVRTSVTHSAAPRVPLFCSYHILTSSVICYWTDARQHGISLLNRSAAWDFNPDLCETNAVLWLLCGLMISLHMMNIVSCNDQLPVGMIAQLVEHCTDITEVMVRVPFSAAS